MTTSETRTIEASVDEAALQKTHLLFNQSPATTIHELLQNSRRAKATQIQITLTAEDDKTCEVEILDNGTGSNDPKKFISYGGTQWDQTTDKEETPAGMGFFSLCHYKGGVEVHSLDWTMHVTPEAFRKEAKVTVEPAEHLNGTKLNFTCPLPEKELRSAIENCVKFYSVPVTINGEACRQRKYLQDALKVKKLDGCELGIIKESHHTGLNFYGLEINTWSFASKKKLGIEDDILPSNFPVGIIVDLFNGEPLDLTLPARDGIVQNGKWEILQAEARKFAYSYIEEKQMEHTMPFKYWEEAKGLGFNLPEASPNLRTVDPISVSCEFNFEPFKNLIDYELQPILKEKKEPNGDKVALSAIEDTELLAYFLALQAEKENSKDELPTLVHPDPKMRGYSWYPTQTIEAVTFTAHHNGKSFPWKTHYEELPSEFETTNINSWPEEITASVELQNGSKDSKKFINVPVKMGFCSNEEGEGYLSSWILTKGTKPEDLGFDLEELLQSLYLSYESNTCEESFNSTQAYFYREVQETLQEMFFGSESKNMLVLNRCIEKMEIQNILKNLGPENLRFQEGEDKSIQIIIEKNEKP